MKQQATKKQGRLDAFLNNFCELKFFNFEQPTLRVSAFDCFTLFVKNPHKQGSDIKNQPLNFL
jgi:hypothetical protein